MTELETLKKRKEQLILERDIVALERNASRNVALSKWPWKWVIPLALVGAAWGVLGLAMNLRDPAVAIVNVSVGVIFAIPLFIKAIFFRK